jgi:hypothetical protein
MKMVFRYLRMAHTVGIYYPSLQRWSLIWTKDNLLGYFSTMMQWVILLTEIVGLLATL